MRVGDILDDTYELLRRAGRGGMGDVFEARNLHRGERVAVKVLHPHLTTDEELVVRFIRELRGISSLNSKHVVKVIESGSTDASHPPYLVMEFLEGEELSAILKREGPLAPSRAAELIRQACRGLATAHSAGVVHRDLKPENIWIEPRPGALERVRILDFGVAKFRDMTKLTRDRSLLGTPCFMAPELLAGARFANELTDIYAVGVILYELLTGSLPYRSKDLVRLAGEILKQAPIPPRKLRPDLSPDLEEVVLKAMARRPEARFQTMRELAEALEPFTWDDIDISDISQPSNPQASREASRAPQAPPGWVRISPGIFDMGSPPWELGRLRDETPHSVTLNEAFLIQRTPVTQAQFRQVMGYNPSHFKGESLPVEWVSWAEAVRFCNGLSRMLGLQVAYELVNDQGETAEDDAAAHVLWRGQGSPGVRLPTEAEWEYACRAGTTTATPMGDLTPEIIKNDVSDDLDLIAWYAANAEALTHPVGEKVSNGWGIHDMLGNVCEWVWDRYGPSGVDAKTDPMGPDRGDERVARGGCWSEGPSRCRSAARFAFDPETRRSDLGFRVVMFVS